MEVTFLQMTLPYLLLLHKERPSLRDNSPWFQATLVGQMGSQLLSGAC